MIRAKPINEDILKNIPKVEAYFRENKTVIFAYLFGSIAKNKQGPLSDVDIAVYLTDGDLANKMLSIVDELSKILRTDEIDLVLLNTAPVTLRMNILRGRRILTDSIPFFRHAFESSTIRSYFDFEKIERSILKRRFLNG